MKRRLVPLLSVSLIALAALAGCIPEEPTGSKQTPVRPVLSTVVADVESLRLSSYPGRAKALKEVNLGFEISGKLLSRPAEVGQPVKAGDVLATLDPAPFQARIRSLLGQKAALEATLLDTKRDLARSQVLLEKEFATQARVDDLIAQQAATEANIEALNGTLDEARLNLRYTTLRAPFDGTVAETFADNFQNIQARQSVVRILDTSKIEMEVAVPEDLINLASFVKAIDVEFSSIPEVIVPAQITRIGRDASTTTRTYPVTIVMDQPSGDPIQPGMAGRATATVTLPEDLDTTGIPIPITAIFSPKNSSPDAKHVWIIDPTTHQVHATPVEVRSFTDRGVHVAGIEKGDRIVVAGANSLTEGQEVRVHEIKE